jgi:hypothetical protein
MVPEMRRPTFLTHAQRLALCAALAVGSIVVSIAASAASVDAAQGVVFYSRADCSGVAYVIDATADMFGDVYIGAPVSRFALVSSVRGQAGCQRLGEVHIFAHPVERIVDRTVRT